MVAYDMNFQIPIIEVKCCENDFVTQAGKFLCRILTSKMYPGIEEKIFLYAIERTWIDINQFMNFYYLTTMGHFAHM